MGLAYHYCCYTQLNGHSEHRVAVITEIFDSVFSLILTWHPLVVKEKTVSSLDYKPVCSERINMKKYIFLRMYSLILSPWIKIPCEHNVVTCISYYITFNLMTLDFIVSKGMNKALSYPSYLIKRQLPVCVYFRISYNTLISYSPTQMTS